ncbi:MAG TPA: septum formation initiator family protein [Bacillota bacterium]|nr:septum formation initiator family protein [Bacillota bacterium]
MKATTSKAMPQGMPVSWQVKQEDRLAEEELSRQKRERIKLQNKRKRLVLTIAMVYGLAVIFSFGHQFFQMQEIQRDMENVQSQIQDMQQRNRELRQEVGRLNTDSYVERIAREKLGLVKPGETVLLQAQVNSKMEPRQIESGKAAPDVNE